MLRRNVTSTFHAQRSQKPNRTPVFYDIVDTLLSTETIFWLTPRYGLEDRASRTETSGMVL